MAIIPKQDRNGVRTPQNLERKYKFGASKKEIKILKQTSDKQEDDLTKINENIKSLEESVDKKVDKEEGKGLSSNDFTDKLKTDLEDAKNEKHSHQNKVVLDTITEADWEAIKKAIVIHNYDLENYKTDNITIVDSKFQVKNDRAVINAKIELTSDIDTNTDIIIFKNLPFENSSYIFQMQNGLCKIDNSNLIVNINEVINVLILNLTFDL